MSIFYFGNPHKNEIKKLPTQMDVPGFFFASWGNIRELYLSSPVPNSPSSLEKTKAAWFLFRATECHGQQSTADRQWWGCYLVIGLKKLVNAYHIWQSASMWAGKGILSAFFRCTEIHGGHAVLKWVNGSGPCYRDWGTKPIMVLVQNPDILP